ncbi:MAG: glycosyltransferase family 8 protein [Lachnospiraceae bacterium]|nr:glycosyltransferase family 8 protein [Lachnospiraceae bacterium]
MKIPIVMACDKSYISQLKVTIWTMSRSACKNSLLEVTILCSEELLKKDKDRIKALENKLYNVKIEFYVVKEEVFQNVKIGGYLSVAACYRLIISEVLQENKCIYLDGDMIVNIDLQSLYLCELDDCYIAGVRDMGFQARPEETVEHAIKYGFHNINNYVNSGVILFNLLEIKENHIQEQFMASIREYYPYLDQDILNKVCDGKIKILESKYNVFCRNEVKEFKEGIFHFAGKYKPWNNCRIQGAREWWEWAKEALEEKEYNDLFLQALNMTEKEDWSYIVKCCLKEKIVIIIGYSNIGVDLCQALKRCNPITKFYYGDNSKDKQTLSNENVKIYPVEELVERYRNALWINTSQRSYHAISNQLIKLGVREDRILVYREKTKSYYEALDDEYIEYELQQLQLRIMGKIEVNTL